MCLKARMLHALTVSNDCALQRLILDRKKDVDSQTKELEVLQARLKETESRLKERVSRNPSPAGRNDGRSSPHQQQGLDDTLNASDNNSLQAPGSGSSPLPPQMSYRAAPGYDQLTSSTRERWGPSSGSTEQEAPRRGSTGYRKPVGQSGKESRHEE